ncbi:MAG: alpha-mannosidase [Anaerolineae bacterium]|nr:alpha-mannosidase [Anaerolineae bacterium]
MPSFKHYTKRHLPYALQKIGESVYTVIAPLEIRAWWSEEPIPFTGRTSGKELVLSVGDKWGDLFDCAWFHFTATVPEAAAGQHVVLLLDVNGEMCVFDAQGVPVRGMTNVASGYDFSLGSPGKRVLEITPQAKGGEVIDVWADAGCNDLFGELCGNGTVKEAAIAICNDEIRALYYDFETLLDLLNVLSEDMPSGNGGPRYEQILTALNDVVHLLYQGTPLIVAEARAILTPLLAKRGGDPSLTISAVGHAHMDLAWLWPIRETIRKGARTFSTAIDLIERYPDYVFGASQPQYFQWMKQYYPALYAKIKEKVRAGRIEAQGAMWVEADTNVSGGEALVRQLLQGKRFFWQEFDVDVRYLWLPDVFGYSGALPQILKLADVDIFSTQKLSWSLVNAFPHQSFHWQGIDGTTVLAHMLPEETYNSPAAPRSVRKIEQNYRDSGVSERALMVFGIGDGGGGPGEEHLERLDRIKNLAGLSPVEQESAADFFEKWRGQADRFATWVGELYLERHEGTLTTNARNKYYNRKMELALRELEWTTILAGVAYPADFLTETWQEVLLYQFHDILPGSSIKRVYDESVARYKAMYTATQTRIAQNDAEIGMYIDTEGMVAPVLVQNSLSWARSEWVQVENKEGRIEAGGWRYVTVPPMGYTVVDAAEAVTEMDMPLVATDTMLENDCLRVTFAPVVQTGKSVGGCITSIYDKRANREVLPEDQVANRLAVYTDLGDAWDFVMDYAEQQPRYMELVSATATVDGPRAILTQVYRIGHSELTQDIILTAGSPRLDFVCQLRWRETQTMLRTSFPVAVHADEAACEIQFGHIYRPTHRNTTWDLARDEVSAHKWVDFSQVDYGVALLNDCKYGYKVKDGVLDLNLLRSAPYSGSRLFHPTEVAPGEPNHGYTDQFDHAFTYALYPHTGDLVEGGVIQAGYALNVPLRTLSLEPRAGDNPTTMSLIEVDAPNVIIEAVKKAEDDEGIVVRLYEAAHRDAHTLLHFGRPVACAEIVNLMETPVAPLDVAADAIMLDFRPFEIKSVKVWFK